MTKARSWNSSIRSSTSGGTLPEVRVHVADDLGEPRPVVAGLVDLEALRRGDDPAEPAGRLLAQPLGFEGVQAERGGVPVWLAQAQGQVDQRELLLSGEELAGQQLCPTGRGGGHRVSPSGWRC